MRLLTTQSSIAVFVLITLTVISLPTPAEETAYGKVKSISYDYNLEKNETTRKSELDQADLQILDPLVQQGFRAESRPAAVIIESTVYYYESDITIFDASTMLISDFDDDGFYHRFSVSIDADTVYSESWVYAELYLSYEGGPWNYYATSSDFHIHGDSELDAFVIETELAEGFPSGYYDVLIELYDADSGHLVQSYGPYDDASLSALPLEDSIYDDDFHSVAYTTEVIVTGHGHGGIGVLMIASFSLIGWLRRVSVKRVRAAHPTVPGTRR